MRVDLPSGLHLNVHTRGRGERVALLIHGWVVSGDIWEPVLASWPDDGPRLIAPDPPGTGAAGRRGGAGRAASLRRAGVRVAGAAGARAWAAGPGAGPRLIAPDLRGTGWSSKPRGGYTL